MINREPGQARKGAATAVDSCAGMWLVGPSPFWARDDSVNPVVYRVESYLALASNTISGLSNLLQIRLFRVSFAWYKRVSASFNIDS